MKLTQVEPMQSTSMTGKHILAEFWQCQCEPEVLTRTEPLLGLLIAAVEEVGLTLVGNAVHEFGQQFQQDNTTDTVKVEETTQSSNLNHDIENQVSGITLTLLLAESHLCLHTWGEYQTVTLDIYVCNVTQDNSGKADALYGVCKNIFKPLQHHVNDVSRQHQIPNNSQH